MSAQAAPRVTVADPFAPAREEFEEMLAHLGSEATEGMSHSDVERDLGQRGQELLRKLYQGWLDEQAEAETETDVVDADGTERSLNRAHERALKTVFGPVRVKRGGYGTEGKASLHPLDGQLNLPEEMYSHELRRRAAEEASKSSFDETVTTIKQYTGAAIPKRQVEELVQRAAQDFDAFYEVRRREASGVREEPGSLLVLTVDAKGVAMLKEDLRPATRKKAEQQGRKLTTRLTKGEKPHRKRMATITAVYTVAPYVRTPEQVFAGLARQPSAEERLPRPRPEAKRVAASLVQTPEQMLEEAFQEGMDRDPRRQKTWAAVVDGNDTQLRLLKKLANKHNIELTIVLDIIHVLDYLWKAGRAFHAEASQELEHWVLERLQRILQGDAGQVAGGMRRGATKRQLPDKDRKPVDTCADYLLDHKRYLAYDQYLAAGLPIGSGVIEGTARHLVGDRMGLTGARWRLTSGEAVLRLRALRTSQDFDDYWHFHEACEHERNHRARYKDGEVPSNHPHTPPELGLVKADEE
jgi:hypothetical protein